MEPGRTDGGATGGWPNVTDDERAVDRRDALRWAGGGVAALLAGCPDTAGGDPSTGPSPAGTANQTGSPEVRIATEETELTRAILGEMEASFTADTGVGLYIESLSAPYRERRSVLLGRGPDVTTLDLHENLRLLIAGHVEPVTALVDGARAECGDLLAEPLYFDGDYWLLPHECLADTFVYRQDVYDELGLSVPTSFRGVLENARAIDESGLDLRGYGLPTDRTYKIGAEFKAYLARMGSSPVGLRWRDPDARTELELHFPKAEVTSLLAFFRDLSQYSSTPPELDWSESIDAWARGEFAQQYTLNNLPIADLATASDPEGDPPPAVAGSAIAPMPYWAEGGIGRDDAWVWNPHLNGYLVYDNGPNTAGARRLLAWLYTEDAGRAARLYRVDPSWRLPAYADLLGSETYRSFDVFARWPSLYDQLSFVQETILGEHYRKRREAHLSHPAAIDVASSLWTTYGEMVSRVTRGASTPTEAYRMGKREIEEDLMYARRWYL